jgi:hypothetical protein
MISDMNKVLDEASQPLRPSNVYFSSATTPTTQYSGEKPDLNEQRIYNERVQLGLLSPTFLNGKWNIAETNLTREEIGDQALAYTIGNGSRGWGEASIQNAEKIADQYYNRGDAMFTPGGRKTSHLEQFVEGFNFFGVLGENQSLQTAEEIKKKIKTVDPLWTTDKKMDELIEWKKINPDVDKFLSSAGIDVQDYALNTRNQEAFLFHINQAVQDARMNIGMGLFERDNNTLEKLGNSLAEGIKDPLIIRDVVLTTAATAGLGIIASVAGLSARALSGGIVAGVNASRSIRGLELARKAANAAALATGPMTGLVEGPAYAAIRSIIPATGRSVTSTLAARGLALGLEGGVAGVISSLADQRSEHEWRSLVFQNVDPVLKYNLGETALAALTGSLGSVGLATAFRFGLGSIGDYKYYKTGDWDSLRRQVTNSMDTWATTRDGDIVWGNTLSDGRGMFFGNVIDNFMKNYDGRDFTNVMLNGSRLFGKFNPRIAGKMNLDVTKVLPVIEEFEKATGIAGEAAMLRVDGVAPETRRVFDLILNEKNLDDANLSLADVRNVLTDYNLTRSKELVGPRPITAVEGVLATISTATKQVDIANQIHRLIGAKSLDRKLETIGIQSSDVINNAEATLGRSINLSDDVDFGNFVVAAKYAAASVDEAQVVGTLKRILSGDFGGGRTIPREVVQSIFANAFGTKPLIITASGSNKNFAVSVDPTIGEVFSTKRTLKVGPNGKLEIELRADDPTLKFFTTDTIRLDTETFKIKLADLNDKLNTVWNTSVKKKIKDTINTVKDIKSKETLTDSFASGKDVTVDNIKKIFKLTTTEATTAKIIMDSLGYSGDSSILRIAKLAADDRNAEIVFEGTTALIRATTSSDLGTVTHEMSHYLQVMVLDNLDSEARQAIGITDDMWVKFKDWVGFTGDEWSEKAAEKFANGMSQYVRRIMAGDGRAPATQIQRLFHRIGDHLGDLGERFKSQDGLEAGLIISAEAESVFEALLNRSNDKIGELFDSAYQGLFQRLSKEKRQAIGKDILGQAAFSDYLAKRELKHEASTKVIDPLAKASSIKSESTTAIINSIYDNLKKSVTRKAVKEAITLAGYTKEEYIKDVTTLLNNTIGQKNITATKPARLDSASKLGDDELVDLYFDLFLAGSTDESLNYISVIIDTEPTLIVKSRGTKTEEDLLKETGSTPTELGGKIPSDPVWILTSRNEKKKTYSKDALLTEINKRKDTGITKLDKSLTVSSELTAALDELFKETGFVDSVGIPVSLTPTEKIVVERTAAAVEASRHASDHVAAVTTALSEDRLLDAALAERAEVILPTVINVEAIPTDLTASLTALGTVGDTAKEEATRLKSSISVAEVKEVKNVVAAVVAKTTKSKQLLDTYLEVTENQIAKDYLKAELRSQITTLTIEGIAGLDSNQFKRFIELEAIISALPSDTRETLAIEQALDRVQQDSSNDAMNQAISVTKWTKQDISLYVTGRFHRTNGSLVSEFIDAKKYVETNIVAYKKLIKEIIDLESTYNAAVTKLKEAGDILSVIEKNKLTEITKSFISKKAQIGKFEAATKRLKLGVLRSSITDVTEADLMLKSSIVTLKTEWLQVDKVGSKLANLIMSKLDNADFQDILITLDKNINKLVDKVVFDGEPTTKLSLAEFNIMTPLDKAEAWSRGNIKSNAASAFVKTVINNLELNAKRRLEGTKKGVLTGDVELGEKRAVSLIESSKAVTKTETKADREDFYYKLEEEVTSLRYVASLFYQHLVETDQEELSKVFMARKQAMTSRGEVLASTARVLENFGITMTTNTVKNRISKLSDAFEDFVSTLPEVEATSLKARFRFEKKKKTLAQRLIKEMTDDELDELDSLFASIQPGESLVAPEFLRTLIEESTSSLYRNIADGSVSSAGEALQQLAESTTSKYATLAQQLLESRGDVLNNIGLHLALYAKDDLTDGEFVGNNIFLNARFGKINVVVLLHEIIHAITSRDLDRYGFDDAAGSVAYLATLNKSIESGVGPNGTKLSKGARSIIQSYLQTIDWIETTPRAMDLLGIDFKEKLIGQTVSQPETSAHYAISNIHEFVAVALTDVSVLGFFGAVPGLTGRQSKPITGMIRGIAESIWPTLPENKLIQRIDYLRKQVTAGLVTGALTTKIDIPDPVDILLPPLMPGTTPFRVFGEEVFKTQGLDVADLLRSNLKSAKGRVYAQLRAVNLQEQLSESARASGADATKFETKLSELIDSAEVRRRNLLAAGLHEEMEPEDLEIIQSMINGTKAFTQRSADHLTRRVGGRPLSVNITSKFVGKSYRDLTDDERRSFVSDVLLPTVENKMGKRNRSAGIYSMITDSTVGKSVNSLIGGGAAYGDTADADSLLLQFFSKIYDPLMDLRDGELSGVFELFSVDLVNAETNNMYSRAGLLNIQRKITTKVSNTAELEQLYEKAWMYLSKLSELPNGLPHRELIVELINGVHKYNEVIGETLNKYGFLADPMNPTEYGTIHKVNMLAFEEQKQFVDALVKHALIKERDSKELSIVTMDALGWIKLVRDRDSDTIVSVTVTDESPLVDFVGTYDYSKFKQLALKKNLKPELLSVYENGLISSRDYKNWDIYKSRGDSYTAIQHTMTVAKNNYLNIEAAESRGGKPRTESIGAGREMDISRILSHSEITNNPELAKYFDKDIFGLINQQLRTNVTEAVMTKYITETFGIKMSWLDLIEVSRKHGEASRGQLTKSEQDSLNRGYDRIKTIWEANTGKMLSSRDGLDRHYRSLLENGSRPLVLAASGLRAALTSTGETVRAILQSNHNRGMLRQVLPNFIQTLKLFSRDKRQTIQQVSSATHWIRGLSSDHLLLRAEMNPNNPFGGTIMGARRGGWFKDWAAAWAGVKERNKLEDSIVGKAANYLSVPASKLGSPLAFVNDITTTLHVQNVQYNLTKNSKKFLALANLLKDGGTDSLFGFSELATKVGLSSKEAIDLSSMGLLDPKRIEVMIEAAKDQRNYREGMLDVQSLFIWAGEDPTKIDTINRMGSLINATVRHTNTDPTLLDLRINQSAYARSMGVFMQFLLSHSTQEIGRRRRYTTTAYSKHLAGLVMMEAIAYSLARTKDEDEDAWVWQDLNEKPFETVVKFGTSLPLLGSYQFLSSLLRAGILETHSTITGEKSDNTYRVPDLFSGPSENIPRKAVDMIKDLL